MAKGKHSTALFEVIHAGKGVQDRRGRQSILRTPTWWFKSKGDQADKADKAEADAPAKPATRRRTTTSKASKAKAEAEE